MCVSLAGKVPVESCPADVTFSVVDPELFIPDPDQALNFPSSRSGSRQKFRIHSDPDPTHVI